MKTSILAVSTLLVVLQFQAAFGGLLAYEGFDYPNDAPELNGLSGGRGWSIDGWLDNDGDFADALSKDDVSLDSSADSFTPVGDRIATSGSSETVRTFRGYSFDFSQDGTVFYASLLFRKSVDGGSGGDNVEFDLGSTTSTQAFRYGSSSGDAFFIDSGANQVIGDPISLGDTYFIVIRGVSSAAGDDEFVAVNYGPGDVVPSSEPTAWDISVSEAVNHVFTGIRLQLGANAAGEFDEIRIGDTWQSVAIPEPASGLLMTMLVGCGLASRRRKGHRTCNC